MRVAPTERSEPLGLQTLLITPPPFNRSRPFIVSPTRQVLLPPSIHIRREIEPESSDDDDEERWCRARGRKRDKRFPPPIPFLVRTADLKCRTPWILHRTYGDDGGRLVIRIVMDESRAYYFRVRRSKGRLTLRLVSLVRRPPPSPAVAAAMMMLSSSMPEGVVSEWGRLCKRAFESIERLRATE
ncbi:hypothetical protein QJS10_CPA06g00596 [Acorus calamus]|uniref:FAF domain-containing protein n=1 Tax=Acorus calamus TaxID=4465 RepID=A0AAV9EIT4_ACOCL|nr:hypothetical protein QJS10_CPA06g00596 [Acorus calamus]